MLIEVSCPHCGNRKTHDVPHYIESVPPMSWSASKNWHLVCLSCGKLVVVRMTISITTRPAHGPAGGIFGSKGGQK
jgi:predicted RNA-binding Zn-ribbon protein involved in translation (DUF1610 family)